MEASISYIIVDGYNLTGICHRDLEAQREKLIEALIKYREKKGHSITVVFDGWKSGAATESLSGRGGIRVIYSRLGENADSVIKRIMSSERHEWIVVSSDRDIANHAWSVNSIPIPSETFLHFTKGAGSYEERFEQEEDDDEYYGSQGKNSRNRLSRKEKTIKRALGKL